MASTHIVLPVVLLVLAAASASAGPGAIPPGASTPLAPAIRLASTPVSPYLIDAWTIEDGLPQSSVTTITQTRDGYLWLGTFGGLARFDGITFQVFTTADTPGLGSNRILALYEDRAGTLWIGTERDGVFMRRGNVFSKPSWDAALPDRQIWAFHETRDGALWVGTANGLVRVRRGEPMTTYRLDDGHVASAITEGSEGTVWFGTHGGGVARIVKGSLRRVPFHEVEPQASVAALYVDSADALWISTMGGLYRLHEERVEHFPLPRDFGRRRVTALLPDGNGGIWLGTEHGLCHERERRITCPRGTRLPGARVRALARDREGNLWIGTEGHGLARLKQRAATTYLPHLPDRDPTTPLSILPIVDDGADGIWMGGTAAASFIFAVASSSSSRSTRGDSKQGASSTRQCVSGRSIAIRTIRCGLGRRGAWPA